MILRTKSIIAYLVLFIFVLSTPVQFAHANPRYASLVIDADSGRIIHQENANSSRYPASLTKLMTLYLTFQSLERGKLSMWQKLKVSSRAAGQPPSRLGLRRGGQITVRDAILATVVKSANDVAVVLAEAIAGTEWQFATMMNRTAKHLGMTRTNFKNASGLHHRSQKSTAKDLARLAIALRRDFPRYYKFFNYTKFRYRGRTYVTHNRVVRSYRGSDGLKTGYVSASGYNLVTSAKRGGHSIVAVVLGGRTSRRRDRHMVKLLDKSFYQLAQGYKGKQVMRVARQTPAPKFKPGGVTLASLAPSPDPSAPVPVLQKNIEIKKEAEVKEDEESMVVEEKTVEVTAVVEEKKEPESVAAPVAEFIKPEEDHVAPVPKPLDFKAVRNKKGIPIPHLRPTNRLTEVFLGGVDESLSAPTSLLEYIGEGPEPRSSDKSIVLDL